MARSLEQTAAFHARLAGYAGLIPFVIPLLVVWFEPAHAKTAIAVQHAYAALILSFLGGIYWGAAHAALVLAERVTAAMGMAGVATRAECGGHPDAGERLCLDGSPGRGRTSAGDNPRMVLPPSHHAQHGDSRDVVAGLAWITPRRATESIKGYRFRAIGSGPPLPGYRSSV